MEDQVPKVMAIFIFMFALLFNYIVIGHTYDFITSTNSGILKWILISTTILTAGLTLFVIPLLIAKGADISIFNIIKAMAWLFTAIAITPLLTTWLWELNEKWSPTGTPQLIIVFLIIFGVICLNYLYPILATLEGVGE